MLTTWFQDARYTVRWLRRSPLFTSVAALSLAIGIGANATIFSVTNALLLRPLPGLAEPDRLVDLGRTTDGSGFDTTSYPFYRDIRERTTTLDGVYGYRVEPSPMSLGGAHEAERVYGSVVTGNYFNVAGTRPALGRLLQDDDDREPGSRAVAVVSHELWLRRFNGDRSLPGQTIVLNGHAFTVVGVTPHGFQGTTLLKPDLWVPMSMLTQAVPRMPLSLFTSRRAVWLVMGGRLKPGVTIAQAQQEMNALAGRLAREYPEAAQNHGIVVKRSAIVPGQSDMVAGFLLILMAIVGLVLLIACANVSGMLLARAAARQREMAVRLAMGAARGRLIRQLLTEAMVLFGVGAIAGVIVSRWLTSLLLAVLPQLPVPIALDIPTDWRVVVFASVVALVAALLSGLAPALQASGADLVPALKTDTDNGRRSRLRLRNVFVSGQVAMSILLVITAGLFFRALQHAAAVVPGFDERGVDVVRVDLALAGYRGAAAATFLSSVLERVRATPGIASATVTVDLPLDGGRMGLGGLTLPGTTKSIDADWNVVRPEFFKTLNLALLRGRDFTDTDSSTAPKVAIVNDALARSAWPGGDAVGQRLGMEGPSGPDTLTVVGIAADARLISLTGPVEPYIYVPLTQHDMSGVSILVRHRGQASAIPVVRAIVRDLNPNLPVSEAMPLSELTAIGLVPQRIAAAVAGSLGVVGLLLAAIGVYGVTAYAVSRRTREIGIRIALGAGSPAVLQLVLRQAMILALTGVAIGAALAAIASHLIESLLFGVRGVDPLTFGSAAALFAVVTLVASYFPARRATRVDPMVALRSE
jgi:predicted permease